jgi:hypothetical protein
LLPLAFWSGFDLHKVFERDSDCYV